jgi:translocation and assembly module TamA
VPEGARVVDLQIRVSPGQLERIGLGVGLLIGDTLGFGAQSASSANTAFQAQNQQQWDVHLLMITEWRNLLGDMLRVRIEERPRLIFPTPFPGFTSETGLGPSLGNRVLATARWPAFLEPRTALFASLSHEYGPIPLYGFFRHELDGRVGLERTFLDGRLYLSGAIRGNLFLPDQDQNLRLQSQRETARVFFLEQVMNLDLRDNPRNPQLGAFFSVGLQEAGFGGISSWDYFRFVADARGYVPLGWGIVLALRFGIGAMFIGDRHGLDPDNIHELYHLGPVSQQLQGGGAVSNRGVPPGLLGDVVRRRVEVRPRPGQPRPFVPPVIVAGGIRRWEGSLELRVPITAELGLVTFADVGNVSRSEDFGFEFLNFAFGFGLRYRTVVGPLRFDVAFRPDALQYVGGGEDPRLRACVDDRDFDCRPVPDVNLGLVRFPGAIHLTIGEAF